MYRASIRNAQSIVKLHPHITAPSFQWNSVGSAQGLFGTIIIIRYTHWWWQSGNGHENLRWPAQGQIARTKGEHLESVGDTKLPKPEIWLSNQNENQELDSLILILFLYQNEQSALMSYYTTSVGWHKSDIHWQYATDSTIFDFMDTHTATVGCVSSLCTLRARLGDSLERSFRKARKAANPARKKIIGVRSATVAGKGSRKLTPKRTKWYEKIRRYICPRWSTSARCPTPSSNVETAFGFSPICSSSSAALATWAVQNLFDALMPSLWL